MPPANGKSPLASGIEWAARITTVALEMVLPGIGGQWLDRKLGTGFLGLLGFVIGLTGGIWHLLAMTGAAGAKPEEPQDLDGKRRTPPESDG
jgi:hypothetical protein